MGREWSEFTPGTLPGASTALPLQSGVQQGKVLSVTSAGVKFSLDATPQSAYGPAPWSLGSYATAATAITGGFKPAVGDRCLVAFAGRGIETAWIVGWWR